MAQEKKSIEQRIKEQIADDDELNPEEVSAPFNQVQAASPAARTGQCLLRPATEKVDSPAKLFAFYWLY